MKKALSIVLSIAMIFTLFLFPTNADAASGSVIVDAKAGLNMRASATTKSTILAKIPNQTKLNYTSDDGTWLKITYNGKVGYIAKQYTKPVTQATPAPTPKPQTPPSPSSTTIQITASDGLNVRQAMNTSSTLLTTIPYGTKVPVISKSGRYYKLTYNGKTGYVFDYYTKVVSQVVNDPTPTTGDSLGKLKITATDGLNVRTSASTSSAIVTAIPYNAEVPFYKVYGKWYYITYAGKSGYIYNYYTKEIRNDVVTKPAPVSTSDAKGTIQVTASDGLTMRSQMSTSSSALGSIPYNQVVPFYDKSGRWYQVSFNGIKGYVFDYYTKVMSLEPGVSLQVEGGTALPTTLKLTALPTSLINPVFRFTVDGEVLSDFSKVSSISYSPNGEGTKNFKVEARSEDGKFYTEEKSLTFSYGTFTGIQVSTDSKEAFYKENLTFKVKPIGTVPKALVKLELERYGQRTLVKDYSELDTVSFKPEFEGPFRLIITGKNPSPVSSDTYEKTFDFTARRRHVTAVSLNEETFYTDWDNTLHVLAEGSPNAVYQVYVNGAPLNYGFIANTEFTWRPTQAGTYNIVVRAKDQFADRVEATTQRTVRVLRREVTSLELSLFPPMTGSYKRQEPITISAKAEGSPIILYRYLVNGSVLQDWTEESGVSFSTDTPGTYTFTVEARDRDSYQVKTQTRTIMISNEVGSAHYFEVTYHKLTASEFAHLEYNRGSNTVQKNGRWVSATLSDVEATIDPVKILGFDITAGIKNNYNSIGVATITTNGLNVRDKADQSGQILGRVNRGERFDVIDVFNNWIEIRFQGQRAFIASNYATITKNPEEFHPIGTLVQIYTLDGLAMRSEPTTSASQVGTAKNGEVYIVLGNSSGWVKINRNGVMGWIYTAYTTSSSVLVDAKITRQIPPSMYQFLNLKHYSGLSERELNEKVLIGKGTLEGQGAAFIEGSKTFNVNEIYLVAHAFLESGNGTSKLARGLYYDPVTQKASTTPVGDGKLYYNMYGIGAYDNDPINGGIKHAYQNGWDTPAKAISGGAKWISVNYINSDKYKQNTLYKMKWNYTNMYHQYATDVSWAEAQTYQMNKMYKMVDNFSFRFEIPVYGVIMDR
ncbi:SH3 domain-containing protein [Guggenheimella bovis]